MTIASRTPEGEPNLCPLCGLDLRLEPSLDTRDGPCPHCGHLLWFPVAESPPRKRRKLERASVEFEKVIIRLEKERLRKFPVDLRKRLIAVVCVLSVQHDLLTEADLGHLLGIIKNWESFVRLLEERVKNNDSLQLIKAAP